MSRIALVMWVGGYALLWSLVTITFDPTVPYDAIEALNWAQNAEWGSPKNPWLVGMVLRPALWLTVIPLNVYWYATHFLAIAIGMAGCWSLARCLSQSEHLAWLALLTLNFSGIINFDIISYNDNYLLVMLWPWMMLSFLLAITHNPNWWLLFAVTAGLATMAKYSSLAFVVAVFISTLLVPKIRYCYRQPAFYIALLLGLILIAPNLYWLWEHNFVAFRWVDSQIKSQFNPGLFTKLLSIFYPLLVLGWILHRSQASLKWPEKFSTQIVLLIYLLPFLLICGWFLFHHGGRLTEWLQPFFILAPALLVGCVVDPKIQPVRGGYVTLISAAGLLLAGYTVVMLANIANAGQKMSGIIPFSQNVEKAWQKRYGTPMNYVGGEYLAEWLTFYAPSRPEIITPWNSFTQPNIYNAHITFSNIRRSGALLIGRNEENCSEDSFSESLNLWPQLKIDAINQVTFTRDDKHEGRLVCIAFVKPEIAGSFVADNQEDNVTQEEMHH